MGNVVRLFIKITGFKKLLATVHGGTGHKNFGFLFML
jgi:hypothetical protein